MKGGYVTLFEVALALKMGKPVIGLHSWDVSKKIIQVETPQEAVKKAIRLVK